MTDSSYYAEEIFHVNPELSYFVLVVHNYYLNKYSQSKVLKTTPAANAKKKRSKKNKNTDTIESNKLGDTGELSKTGELEKGYQPGKTESSLTNLLADTETAEDLDTDHFKKVTSFLFMEIMFIFWDFFLIKAQ